jgi:hypothetical protein
MHKPQLSEFTMDPRSQRQPLPSPPFVNPLIMQQLLELHGNIIPWFEGFYAGSLYQGMAQQHQQLYRTPSSGPRRNQRRKGSRKTEAPYHYNSKHEPSETIAGDCSTGTNPGYAQIGAYDNTRTGKVWRTPSGTSLMADHNPYPQMRTKPYNRDRSSRIWKSLNRTDKIDPSVYAIPIMGSKSTLISLSILQ